MLAYAFWCIGLGIAGFFLAGWIEGKLKTKKHKSSLANGICILSFALLLIGAPVLFIVAKAWFFLVSYIFLLATLFCFLSIFIEVISFIGIIVVPVSLALVIICGGFSIYYFCKGVKEHKAETNQIVR